ncbi:peroxiredoxin [Chitinophaga nivalis]|uniref:Alkyl hydroperoxide reductase C n=1 Tax=Chitinophaga nivalis TaxID=2991709 RepID=A0ABT3IP80_9BACT|nr:peroxiredoxin [Chitinophaga nivalis]MCW3464531.1 peroxiredoxin [Chitinophaga nivalis]MCW3485778.1 peroxiredoxin [Chitinophaga nivalis]
MCNSMKSLMKEYNTPERQGPLNIGDKLPAFCKKAVVPGENGYEVISIDQQFAAAKEKWLVLFWWPKDFTFVCPTEIIAFNAATGHFQERSCLVMGASTDTEHVHLAWLAHHPGLKALRIPLLADTSKSLATDMGILDKAEKVAYRATYIIDPAGVIRWLSIHDMQVGRNVEEVLRVLDALQTTDLTPCGWKPGEQTLTAQLTAAGVQ